MHGNNKNPLRSASKAIFDIFLLQYFVIYTFHLNSQNKIVSSELAQNS